MVIKVLLIYFSGTGITRHFATLIQERMAANGYSCDLLDLEELTDITVLWQKKPVALPYTIRAEVKRPLSNYPWPYLTLDEALHAVTENPVLKKLENEWADYDLIGFGSPVYGFRPAPIMIRFLLDLPNFKKPKKVFSFATHDGAQGDYENFTRQVLTDKGFKFIGHIDHSFVYSASVIMRKSFDHLSAGRLLVRKSALARQSINFFLKYLDNVFKGIPDIYRITNPLSIIFGLPYRLIYSYGIDFLLNHFLFGFGIHKKKCIQCMTCVMQCPQGLIELDEDGYPLRLYHCMYCLRCLNWCPTDALYFSRLTDGKARFPGPEVLLEAANQDEMASRLRTF